MQRQENLTVQSDWSKHLADKWGLAYCREDAELNRQVAPFQPLRRLYRRLCHDPKVPFFPPGFAVVIFNSMIFLEFSIKKSNSLVDWLMFLGLGFGLSTVMGIFLDILFFPLLLVLNKMLETLCWIVDKIIFNQLILIKKP